jgi:hypothetical protein
MSTKFLVPLLQKLAGCRTAADVSGVAMDAAKVTFACRTGAALLLDEVLAPVERTYFGCREDDVEEYLEHWRPLDRVFPVVIARGVPMHNWQMYTEDEWHKDAGYNGYGRRLEIYHSMAAPIFGAHGRLTGVMNFCRRSDDRRFDETTLDMATAFSGFLSATLARVGGAAEIVDDHEPDGLAPRELQLARETVKQTLRRVYRKLEVSGRAEMAATLAARGILAP